MTAPSSQTTEQSSYTDDERVKMFKLAYKELCQLHGMHLVAELDYVDSAYLELQPLDNEKELLVNIAKIWSFADLTAAQRQHEINAQALQKSYNEARQQNQALCKHTWQAFDRADAPPIHKCIKCGAQA